MAPRSRATTSRRSFPAASSSRDRRAWSRGQQVRFDAFAAQPVFVDSAKVPRLELRDPAPLPRASSRSSLAPALMFFGPVLLLGGGLLVLRVASSGPRGRAIAVLGCAGLVVGGGSVALAQRSAPDVDARVLASVPGADLDDQQPARAHADRRGADDARRDPPARPPTALHRRLPRPHLAVRHVGLRDGLRRVVVRSRPASGSCARSASAAAARPSSACASGRSCACGASSATSARCMPAACLPRGKHVVSLGRRRGRVKVIVTSDRKPAVERLRVR